MKNFSFVSIFLILVLIFNAHTSLVIWILLGVFSAIDMTVMYVEYKAEKKRDKALLDFINKTSEYVETNETLMGLMINNTKGIHQQNLGIIDNLRKLRAETKDNYEASTQHFSKILKVADPIYKPFTDIQMKQLTDFILQHFPNAIDRSRNKK